MDRKKQIMGILLAALITVMPLSGCTNSAYSVSSLTSSETTSEVVSTADINTEFTARDLEVGYEESTATKITLSDQTASVNGSGAEVSGNVITISEEGTYVVSGSMSNGRIVIDADDSAKIHLIFNGAQIHSDEFAPLFIKSADKVFLTLQDGSENTLSDASSYTVSEENTNVDGVIFSKADLTINGSGSLNITGNYKHGIVSKDDLVITGGTINVTAQGQGLYGKDCVKIKDGTFTLTTGGDGIQSDNSEDEKQGFVYIAGGNFTITSGTDAVQAQTVLRIDDGVFELTTGGGSQNTGTKQNETPNADFGSKQNTGVTMQGMPNGTPPTTSDGTNSSTSNSTASDSNATTSTSSTGSESAKGLKSGSELILNGGDYTIDSFDDSVHCNGNVTIAGGNLQIKSGDDGVHADSALLIENGTIMIASSYEGLEGLNVTIQGGSIDLTSSDDGINAADGNDSSSTNGQMGQNQSSTSSNSDVWIRISGGNITVNASGDGLDANGALYIDGGETYVSGPTDDANGALDYDTTAQVTGGILIAAGSTGMAQGFSDSSSQCSLLHNFSSSIAANSEIKLTDSDGKEITSFTPAKVYQSIVITAPGLTAGNTYTLTAGSQSASITLSGMVTSNATAGMNGGQMGGGKMEMNQNNMQKSTDTSK